MDQLLSRPEIQSAVVPFIVGLLFFLGTRKISSVAWLWAVFIAFLISAILINGFTVTPLTGTRKIILLILASFILSGLISHLVPSPKMRRTIISITGVGAFIWVFWKIVLRMEAVDMAIFLSAGVAHMLWLIWTFERLNKEDAHLNGAGFSLLLGTGLCAMVGASALLGQLALSLSTASAGAFLAWVLMGRTSGSNYPMGSSFPYALSAALIGLAAVIFARVPWYALIPLAAIPWLTSYVPIKFNTRFTNALVSSLPGLIIALASTFWVWNMGSSSSGY